MMWQLQLEKCHTFFPFRWETGKIEVIRIPLFLGHTPINGKSVRYVICFMHHNYYY